MTASASSEMARSICEDKVAGLRATKQWILFDRRVKYAMDLLDGLVERHGGTLYHYMDVNVFVVGYNLDKLTGLKDPKLESLLNSLLHADSDKQETSDSAAYYSRTYSFRWYDPNDTRGVYRRYFKIEVQATFAEDSETCKRTVVGYKPASAPEPIYKLSCEGEEQQQPPEAA